MKEEARESAVEFKKQTDKLIMSGVAAALAAGIFPEEGYSFKTSED